MAASSARNPELESIIEKNPDDLDGYFVYGDWLHDQSDARGELISLHAALLRKPGDRALVKTIGEHLAKHKAQFLGELASYGPKELEIEWQLGFIRRARITFADSAKIKEALTRLLGHPSGRFLQSLAIAQRTINAAEWVRFLIDTGKPATLKDLALGAPGTWDIEKDKSAGELRKTFPRLQQSLEGSWGAIMATIAGSRRIDPKVDASTLSELDQKPGVELGSINMHSILVGLKMEVDKKKDVGLVNAMRRAFTRESLDRFVTELANVRYEKWVFQVIGLLGHDRGAHWIARQFRRWSHARSVLGAEILGQIGSSVAIYELYGMVIEPRLNRPRRNQGAVALQKAADARELSIDQLVDRSAPLALDGDEIERPSPASEDNDDDDDDNEEAVDADSMQAAIQSTFDERARLTTIRRLEHHMIDGRRIPPHDFRHYIADHPFVRSFAARVVWAIFDEREVTATFRVDPVNGRAIDASGAPISPAALSGGDVGVLHPAEIADERARNALLRTWKQVFEKAEIEQIFPQIDRPVFALREQEQGDTIARFKLRRAEFNAMRAVMQYERDWEVVDQHDQGGTAAWGKMFRRDNVDVTARLGGYGSTIESLTGNKPFRAMSPVTVSEILYDAETATAKPPQAERRESAESAEARTSIKKGQRVRIGIRGGEGRGKRGVVFWIGDQGGIVRCGVRDDDDETHWVDARYLEVMSEEALENERKQKKRDAEKAKKKASSSSSSTSTSTSGKKKKTDEVFSDEGDDDDAARFIARNAPAAAAAEEEDGDDAKVKKGTRVTWKNGRNSGTGVVFWIGEGKFGGGPRAGVKDDDTGETVWVAVAQCTPEGATN